MTGTEMLKIMMDALELTPNARVKIGKFYLGQMRLAEEEGRKKECERWSENMQAVWSALKMVRDYIEHQVVGAVKAEEHIPPPHPENEAKEIIKGIEKIQKDGLKKALKIVQDAIENNNYLPPPKPFQTLYDVEYEINKLLGE